MVKPRAAISWSGGKDCCTALLRAHHDYDIAAMVTMFAEDGERSRSHGLRPDVIAAHAQRLGVPSLTGRCSWSSYTDLIAHWLVNGAHYSADDVFRSPVVRPLEVGAWLVGFGLYQWLAPYGPHWWTNLWTDLNPAPLNFSASLPSFGAAFGLALLAGLVSRRPRPAFARA